MLTQTNLLDIGLTLARYLRDDSQIQAFCQEHFGKKPTFIVGEVLRRDIPTMDKCPYIVITNLQKKEGTRILVKNRVEYSAQFYIGIDTNYQLSAESDSVYVTDPCTVISEFMGLIQERINERKDRSRPVDECTTEILGSMEPNGGHWVGTMDMTWRIDQTLNLIQNEEF